MDVSSLLDLLRKERDELSSAISALEGSAGSTPASLSAPLSKEEQDKLAMAHPSIFDKIKHLI